MIPTLEDIKAAATRIKPYIHRTPVLTSTTLNQMTGATLFFKCENFQKIGAFKIRGACNAVFSLPDAVAKKGVATHSSGNHAQAVALAAKLRGIDAFIVMPNDSPQVKKEAVAGYGGKITFCEPTQAARESTLNEIVKKTGATFIPPYDNYMVIVGQGTVGLEFLEQCSDLDCLVVPVGGGGLISGNSLAAAELAPRIKIIGAEPKGADDAYQSFLKNEIVPSINASTICDGLLTNVGKLTFPIIKKYVSEIITVTDEEVLQALRLLWERMKIVVEPSGAIGLAVVFKNRNYFANKKVGIILSGGNVDIKKIAALL